jgi:hypothetical protein
LVCIRKDERSASAGISHFEGVLSISQNNYVLDEEANTMMIRGWAKVILFGNEKKNGKRQQRKDGFLLLSL